MIVPRYTPGQWNAVITESSIALLAPETDRAVVEAVWAFQRDGADLTVQLQPLLRAGLAAMPPFALVTVLGDVVHVIARGEPSVTVRTADGVRTVSGERAATWVEEAVRDAVSVTALSPGTTFEETTALPAVCAVVTASAVRMALREDVAPESVPDTGRAGASEPGPGSATGRRSAAGRKPAAGPALAVVPHVAPEPARAVAELGPVPAPDPAVAADLEMTVLMDPPQVDDDGEDLDDHDGLTVLTDVVPLRREGSGWGNGAMAASAAAPTMEAVLPARIIMSTGMAVSLSRPVLIGRAPQVSRVTGDELPRLVTVTSPNHDISRTHAQVRQDGDDVLVTDLNSTNGVLLISIGSEPRRLHPGEPTVLEPGMVADLGEGVTFTVERGT